MDSASCGRGEGTREEVRREAREPPSPLRKIALSNPDSMTRRGGRLDVQASHRHLGDRAGSRDGHRWPDFGRGRDGGRVRARDLGVRRSRVRAGIRATAGTSFALFLTAFVASSLNTLRPTPATKWLLRNRRYIGVSFAVSQLAHLLLIEDLSRPARRADHDVGAQATVVGGGFGYVMLLAMTITSFDRTARWLGRQRWSVLHTTGMYVSGRSSRRATASASRCRPGTASRSGS